MIEVASLIRKIRFKVGDFDETQFTDYEILQYMNDVLEYINNSYALQNTDFLEKSLEYNAQPKPNCRCAEDGIKLPKDMIALINIRATANNRPLCVCPVGAKPKHNEYYISNDKIYTDCPSFVIIYRRRIAEVTNAKDTIDLPEQFTSIIRNGVVSMLLKSDVASVQDSINDQLETIIPRRRYVNARIPMPF